jgi:hypothetical protein
MTITKDIHVKSVNLLNPMLALLKSAHVDMQQQMAVIERIRAMVSLGKLQPSHIMVLEADTCMGKSRVVDILCGTVTSALSKPLNVSPHCVLCKPGMTGRMLGEALAREVGVAPFGIGTPARFGDFISQQIDTRGGRPLIVENAHLLVDDTQLRNGVLEVLGSVVAAGACSLLLVGRRNTTILATKLVESVGQQAEFASLSPFPFNAGADLPVISDFLGLIAEQLRPVLKPAGISLSLHNENMAKRFWAGSWGAPGNMIAILREGLRAVMATGNNTGEVRKITAADFADAWRTLFVTTSLLKFNPFVRDDPPTLGDVADARAKTVKAGS